MCLGVYGEVQKNKRQLQNDLRGEWGRGGDAGCCESPWRGHLANSKGAGKTSQNKQHLSKNYRMCEA